MTKVISINDNAHGPGELEISRGELVGTYQPSLFTRNRFVLGVSNTNKVMSVDYPGEFPSRSIKLGMNINPEIPKGRGSFYIPVLGNILVLSPALVSENGEEEPDIRTIDPFFDQAYYASLICAGKEEILKALKDIRGFELYSRMIKDGGLVVRERKGLIKVVESIPFVNKLIKPRLELRNK